MGWTRRADIPFYLLTKSSVVPMGVLVVCAAPVPDGAGSSAFGGNLGGAAHVAPCSGHLVWVMAVATSLSLTPETRQPLSRS